MVTSIGELTAFSFLNYIPYMLIALYPFRNTLRFRRIGTCLLFVSFFSLQTFLLILEFYFHVPYTELCSLISTLLGILFYFIAVKSRLVKILFHMLVITNVANLIVVLSKAAESLLFPQYTMTLYHWTFILCMFLVELVVLIPFFYFVKSYINYENLTEIEHQMWSYAWLIPATFYVLWFFVFYHISDRSSLELAADPSISCFNLIIILGQLLIYAFVAKLFSSYGQLMELQEEKHRFIEQQIHYNNIQAHIREIRIYVHDSRHHLNILRALAQQKDYEKLESYLNDMSYQIDSMPQINYCQHMALNLLLVDFAQMCKFNSIDFDCHLQIPDNLPLPDIDVSVLFGNLLENALHACYEVPANRKIIFKGFCKGKQIIFTLDNTYCNEIKKDKHDNFISTKEQGSGYGTASARNIIKKHQGVIRFEEKGNMFCVSIMLKL